MFTQKSQQAKWMKEKTTLPLLHQPELIISIGCHTCSSFISVYSNRRYGL